MSEIEKLTALRQNLIARRRALAGSLAGAAPAHLTGESISRIQSAIDAVDRALEDERRIAPAGA